MGFLEKFKASRRQRKLLKAAKSQASALRLFRNMNCDRMTADELQSLGAMQAEIEGYRKIGDYPALSDALAKPDPEFFSRLEPRPFSPVLKEIVDTLVVALGVAMAFRAYFFQPFKIPTGSMQPTLYGMHSEAASGMSAGDEPGASSAAPSAMDKLAPLKVLQFCLAGKWYMEVVASEACTVRVVEGAAVNAPGNVVVYVGDKAYKVPRDAYDRGDGMFNKGRQAELADKGISQDRATLMRWISKPGERIWAGWKIFGDHVFVNRMRWNFFPPRRGDIMVFSTDNIRYVEPNQHYIKRMVGLPGDEISIDAPYLVNHGKRITEPDTILRNTEGREAWKGGPHYNGYILSPHPLFGTAKGEPGRSLLAAQSDVAKLRHGERPEDDEFLAMGDNTPSSFDGRYWGPVKRRNLVGPGSFVYWPYSPRWGRAK